MGSEMCIRDRSVPNERFRVMPRALDQAMIDEIVAGYAAAARRLHQAGIDGVEVVMWRVLLAG